MDKLKLNDMKKAKINLKEILEKQSTQIPKIEESAKPNNHKEKILELLKEGWHLSKIQILNKIGCWNSGARIHELRKEGHPIKTEMIENVSTGVRFAVYYYVK